MQRYSKLNLSKHTLLLCAAEAALPRLGSYDAQSISTLAWGFANLEVEHGPLLTAICLQAKARPSAFDSASCAQLLWALSRLSDGVQVDAMCTVAQRLSDVMFGALGNVSVSHLFDRSLFDGAFSQKSQLLGLKETHGETIRETLIQIE